MKQSKNCYVPPCAHYITLQDDVMVITGSNEGSAGDDVELSKENFSADESETTPGGHDVWSSWEE